MLAGLDLDQIISLIENRRGWVERYRHLNCPRCEDVFFCLECENRAYTTHSAACSKLPWLKRMKETLGRIKAANQLGGLKAMQMVADDAMHAFYAANLPPMAEDSIITRWNVHGDRSDPFYPSVTVYAKSWLKTVWAGFLGVIKPFYSTDVCAQGDTSYIDPREDKWIKPPPEACCGETELRPGRSRPFFFGSFFLQHFLLGVVFCSLGKSTGRAWRKGRKLPLQAPRQQ